MRRAYLIHTRDGRVYQVPPEAGYPADYLRGSNRNRGYTVQFDRAGNLYYLNRKPHGKEEVVKLTIGRGVTAKIISYKYDTDIRLFWVDSDGNVMYNFTHQNSFRLINSDGVPLGRLQTIIRIINTRPIVSLLTAVIHNRMARSS